MKKHTHKKEQQIEENRTNHKTLFNYYFLIKNFEFHQFAEQKCEIITIMSRKKEPAMFTFNLISTNIWHQHH